MDPDISSLIGLNIPLLIDRIDKLKKVLDGLRPILGDHQKRIDSKLQLEWTYNSNVIEGNTLTLGETKTFLAEMKIPEGGQSKPERHYLEMAWHRDALKFLDEFIHGKEQLSESYIREMHKLLLKA